LLRDDHRARREPVAAGDGAGAGGAGAQCASRGDRAYGGAYRHLWARPVVRVDRPRGRAPGFTKAGLGFGCPRGRAPGFTKAGLCLSSIEAAEVDDRIARLLIEAPQSLAAHLHAPLQSGSNRVLKRMGRHWYTAELYRARLEWLAARLPVFGLGADVIAGFPGETDANHRATLALLKALPFTYLHVFPFSVRPDAAAARLSDECSPAVVHGRARELRELGEAK